MIVSPDQMMAMLAPQAVPQTGETPAPSGSGEKWQIEMERASRSLPQESPSKSDAGLAKGGAGLASLTDERSTRNTGTAHAESHNQRAGERKPWQPGQKSAGFEQASLQQQKPAKPPAGTAANVDITANKPSESAGTRAPVGKTQAEVSPTWHQSSNFPADHHKPGSSIATPPGSEAVKGNAVPSPINIGGAQALPGVVREVGTSVQVSGGDEKLGVAVEAGAVHGPHPERMPTLAKHRHGVKADALTSSEQRDVATADRPASEVPAQLQAPSAGNQANATARRAQATAMAAIAQSKDKLEPADPALPGNAVSAKDQPPPAPLNQHAAPPPMHQAIADKSQHDMSYGTVYSAAQDADPAADPFPSKLMHTFQENGDVQVWIRDAELSLPQAYVIARNMGNELSGAGYRLNSLMLNGRKVGSLFEGNMYAEIDALDQDEAS